MLRRPEHYAGDGPWEGEAGGEARPIDGSGGCLTATGRATERSYASEVCKRTYNLAFNEAEAHRRRKLRRAARATEIMFRNGTGFRASGLPPSARTLRRPWP